MKRHAENEAEPSTSKHPKMDCDPLKDKIIWSKILPYLELVDIESFAQTHPDVRQMICSVLSSGTKLVIGTRSVMQYSPFTDATLYENYSDHATNVEFKGIFIEELNCSLHNIHTLTLRDIPMEQSYSGPQLQTGSVKSLRLINIRLEWDLLDDFVNGMANLEDLFLEDNGFITLASLPRLSSLTLIRQTIYTYENCTGFPSLKRLTLDNWKTLPRDDIKCPPLDYLKIIETADPIRKPAIDSWNAKTTDVNYFHVPTKDGDIPLLRLNEYCLLHLQTFLSADDIYNFRQIHSDFENLAITKLSLNQYPKPIPMDDLDQIGHLILDLNGPREITPSFLKLLRACVHLQGLQLNNYKWHQSLCSAIPAGLNRLVANSPIGGSAKLRGLFKRLNPSLRVLELLQRATGVGLENLHHIQKFTHKEFEDTENMLMFLRQNEGTLIKLELHTKKPVLKEEFWHSLARMNNLRTLVLDCRAPIPAPPKGILPQLQNLTIITDEGHYPYPYHVNKRPDVGYFLGSLEGSQLQYLNVPGSESNALDVVRHSLRFTGLKDMNLHTVTEEILELIVSSLPNVENVKGYTSELEYKTLVQYRALLAQQKRKLRVLDHSFE